MANNIVIAEANRLLNASLGTVAFVAPTAPLKVALLTSVGSNVTAGTEVTGGSYTRQTVTFAASANGTASNSNSISFSSMPSSTITGLEIYDSAGTPRRIWQGALSAAKTVGAGDSLSFAVGAISIVLT